METAAVAAHRRGFAELSPGDQDRLLQRLADASQNKEGTFFYVIKELTVVGYFTSEPVGKNVLHYDPVPGPYRGCIPIAEVGNVNWTSLR